MKRIIEKKHLRMFLGAAVCLGMVVAAPAQSGHDEPFMEHLRYLASDELKGRGNGSEELEQAARYIAEHYREAGLLPAGEGDTYFQEFELTLGQGLGSRNQITFQFKDGPMLLEPGEDYVPLTSGPDNRVEGPLVFVGYGITAPELDYDDYGDLDVEGKIVVAFEHEPQEKVEGSVFAGNEMTPYATPLYKIMNARSRGAAAVILLSDDFNHPEVVSSPPEGTQVTPLGIHSVRLTRGWGQRLLSESGLDPDEITGLISSQLTPQTLALDYVGAIDLDLIKVRRTVRNVLGFIPGQTDRIIILGAHYDHLGLGLNGALAPDLKGQIHNGADDNASGTAGLMQLAQEFSESSPRHGLLFIAFAGEELGLLGSRYYTEHPTLPLEDSIAMINMDMIGRSDGDILIGGVGSAAEWRPLLDEIRETSSLEFSYSEDSRGSSDHLSFASKRVPVLFFFSGLHSDYHRPSDDWERIQVAATREIIHVVHRTVERVADFQEPFEFVETRRRPFRGRGARRSSRPRFGTMLDVAWSLGGVRFERIVEGSPAAKAGLKDGDVLVAFEGRPILDLRDFTSALTGKNPGDEVGITVLRDAELVRTSVVLARWQ
ncbi:MAG: M28 family peptidase [Acidobacteriota bacterium]|nr:M28 family peptidase [Acidobacteriota bacterium]